MTKASRDEMLRIIRSAREALERASDYDGPAVAVLPRAMVEQAMLEDQSLSLDHNGSPWKGYDELIGFDAPCRIFVPKEGS